MNESIVIEVDGDRRTITVTDAGKATAADMNRAIAEAFPGVSADRLPHVLTEEERDTAAAKYGRERRANLLATIRSYPEADVKRALAAAKRKGWGLDGMSLAKLAEVATYLTDEPDDY